MKRILYTSLLLLFTAFQVNAQNQGLERSLPAQEYSFSLYPVPTTGMLHIVFNKSFADEPMIRVFDVIGNQVEKMELSRENASSFVLNLFGSKPGYYIITISGSGYSFSRRITITA